MCQVNDRVRLPRTTVEQALALVHECILAVRIAPGFSPQQAAKTFRELRCLERDLVAGLIAQRVVSGVSPAEVSLDGIHPNAERIELARQEAEFNQIGGVS